MTEELIEKHKEKLKEKEEKIQQLEKEIEEKEKKLNELNRDLENRVLERTLDVRKLLMHKNRFIDNLSHDLGTPLTPLMTLLPVIKDEVETPETKKLVETCLRNAEYIKRVVDNTRKLAELYNTDLMLKKENLYDIVKSMIDKYDVVFKSFNIEVENSIGEEVHVKTEKAQLEELLDQLISNAVNSMPDGGKLVFDSKYIKEDDKTYVKVSLKDNGVGLTREQTDRLFEEFYKADESRHKLDSTGLGLSICKNIVEKHGGHIWADSHGEGTGTTMYFTLPSTEIAQTRSF
ncbi:MAG: HAMP domain-containing sensor histidine kinase [Candidatus Thermoplasmatota archaeon]